MREQEESNGGEEALDAAEAWEEHKNMEKLHNRMEHTDVDDKGDGWLQHELLRL